MMPNSERKYTAKDFIFEDKTYNIKECDQRVVFHPFVEGVRFEELFEA